MSMENCNNALPSTQHRLIPRLHSALPPRSAAAEQDRREFLASVLEEALVVSQALNTLIELRETENTSSSTTNPYHRRLQNLETTREGNDGREDGIVQAPGHAEHQTEGTNTANEYAEQ